MSKSLGSVYRNLFKIFCDNIAITIQLPDTYFMAKTQSISSFFKTEISHLNNYELKHNPTIGSMYEGLVSDVLGKLTSDFAEFEIISGFIFDSKGNVSCEIDRMIVLKGKGPCERVPYSDKFKYHISCVLAVVEVKKTLNKGDLKDALGHLAVINNMSKNEFTQLLDENKLPNHYGSMIYQLYNFATGKKLKSESLQDAFAEANMTERGFIYFLLIELIRPVTIIHGVNGLSSENALRRQFKSLASSYLSCGQDLINLPSLVISGEYSIIKTNGLPYTVTPISGMEGFMGLASSMSTPPVSIIDEIFRSKLVSIFGSDFSEKGYEPVAFEGHRNLIFVNMKNKTYHWHE